MVPNGQAENGDVVGDDVDASVDGHFDGLNGQVNINQGNQNLDQNLTRNENEDQNEQLRQQHITFRGNASGDADEAEVILPLPWENLQPGERTVYINLNRVQNQMRVRVRRHRRHGSNHGQ